MFVNAILNLRVKTIDIENLGQWFSEVVSRPAISVLFGKFISMENIRPHSRTTDSEMVWHSVACLKSTKF